MPAIAQTSPPIVAHRPAAFVEGFNAAREEVVSIRRSAIIDRIERAPFATKQAARQIMLAAQSH
jgi:hypothetical protein